MVVEPPRPGDGRTCENFLVLLWEVHPNGQGSWNVHVVEAFQCPWLSACVCTYRWLKWQAKVPITSCQELILKTDSKIHTFTCVKEEKRRLQVFKAVW